MVRFAGLFALMLSLSFVAHSATADGPKSKDSTKKEAAHAALTIEWYKDNAGEYRFRIKLGDENIAQSSKGYAKKADCEAAIKEIQSHAAKAKVTEGK